MKIDLTSEEVRVTLEALQAARDLRTAREGVNLDLHDPLTRAWDKLARATQGDRQRGSIVRTLNE
jgi:hypothetical protein